MEIDHEIISMVILLPSADSFKNLSPQALSVLRWPLCVDYSLCAFAFNVFCVVLLAFKPTGSVRSKASIMLCLFIVFAFNVCCGNASI